MRIKNNVSSGSAAIPTHNIVNELLYRIHHYLPNALIHRTNDNNDRNIDDWEGHTGIICTKYDCRYPQFNYDHVKFTCPLSGVQHTKSNLFVSYHDDNYSLCCYKCRNYYVNLGHIYDNDEYKTESIGITSEYNIMNRDEFRETLQKLRKDDYAISLSRLWLNKFTDYTDATHSVLKWYYEDKCKCLAIKAAMGTGKTEIIKHVCASMEDYPNILYVTHRRTLSNNLISRFSEYGFEMYMNDEISLTKAKRIICSIDSLPRLFEKKNNGQVRTRFHLVILDEIESLLAHFTSPHIKLPRRTFDTLKIIC